MTTPLIKIDPLMEVVRAYPRCCELVDEFGGGSPPGYTPDAGEGL